MPILPLAWLAVAALIVRLASLLGPLNPHRKKTRKKEPKP